MNDISKAGLPVENGPHSRITMVDEDDRIFYDAAVKASAYLVTGNTRHFPSESFVVTPANFLSIYQQAGGG
ncbi:MAG: hypothetical protein FWG99_03770 [Treponema sp.]|nr:hypothetical protein [Treponema sp.]